MLLFLPPVSANTELNPQTEQTIIDGALEEAGLSEGGEWSHNFHFLRGVSQECTGIRFRLLSAELPPEEALAVAMK